MSDKEPGYVYILTNPSFKEDWVKIGKNSNYKTYLSLYVYKFNRRYFGEDLLKRLEMISAEYRTDFEYRTYRKAA